MSCAELENLWDEYHRSIVALNAAAEDLFANELRDSGFMQRRITLQQASTFYLAARRAFVIHSSEHGCVRGRLGGEAQTISHSHYSPPGAAASG